MLHCTMLLSALGKQVFRLARSTPSHAVHFKGMLKQSISFYPAGPVGTIKPNSTFEVSPTINGDLSLQSERRDEGGELHFIVRSSFRISKHP